MQQERRKVTRTRVLKAAKMLLGKSSVIDCVARDLTNSGAWRLCCGRAKAHAD
jgi:hypothetical protein